MDPQSQQPQQPNTQQPYNAPQPPQMNQENPGKTLGIVSLVTSIIGMGLVGVITGIIGLKKSKSVGQSNGMALAGIIIGAIGMVVTTIAIILLIGVGGAVVGKCNELGPGTHQEGATTITCGSGSSSTSEFDSSF
jgi:hypothetical protein